MENFNYVRPAKVADAVKAMKKAKDGKFMSGGMTLLPTMKQGLAAPTDIIDLGGLKNSGVKVGAKSATVLDYRDAARTGLRAREGGGAEISGQHVRVVVPPYTLTVLDVALAP